MRTLTVTQHPAIPCMIIRGGTSKGIYFNHKVLPAHRAERNALLIRLLGAPDPKQIDGLGGGTPVTSKIAMLRPSKRPNIDIDYEFAQVVVEKGTIDFPTCGNILSGVGIFAIETGMLPTQTPQTTLTIFDVNTGAVIRQTLQTPEGKLSWTGATANAGIPGTAAPVVMEFTNIVGGKTGAFYPSGQAIDTLDTYPCSLIDVAMPCVYFRATSFNLRGNETKQELDANKPLLKKLLALRILAGERMGIPDVGNKVYPKLVLVSSPEHTGTIQARYFTPYQCHPTYAASGGFSLAAACIAGEGNIPSQLERKQPDTPAGRTSIEHPSGIMHVDMTLANNELRTLRGKIIRTARPIMQGLVYVP